MVLDEVKSKGNSVCFKGEGDIVAEGGPTASNEIEVYDGVLVNW